MEGRNRFQEDISLNERDTEELARLASDFETRVIRSHRRPPAVRINRRGVVIVLILSVSSGVLTASNADPIPVVQTVAIAAPVIAAEPLSLPLPTVTLPPPPVEPEREREVRASRKVERKAKPVKPIARVEIVIRYALAQQGDPYRWASSGPNSFDCSGLVLSSFKRIGIKLPHFTGSMINYGQRVSRSNMKRGDIIFPTSGHVGIYLGNGKMVHASSGKGRVVVANVYSFYTAKRIL